MKKSGRSLNKFRAAAALTSGSMNTLGAAMLGGPVLAAGALVISIGRAALAYENFNQGMQRSLAIMGDVSGAMRDRMSQAAIKMARVSVFSAREVADSFFFLASAGLDAQQSLAALPAVMKFAQAGMFNMARATELLTDAVSALGLKSKDPTEQLRAMVDVGDLLVKANTLADATTEQFAQSLVTKAAAASKFFNISMQQTVGVLAAFAERGVKAQDAGVAFNIVLRDMTTKAIKNADEFKRLGITVFDAAGEFTGIANVIEDLEQRLGGMSDIAAKSALIMLGFSDKSVVFTQNLLGSSAAIKEFTEELENAAGTMDAVQKKQLTEFAAAWENLKGSIIGASSKLGPITSQIGEGMQKIAEAVDAIDSPKATGIFFELQKFVRAWVSGGASLMVRQRDLWGETVDKVGELVALQKKLIEDTKRQLSNERFLAELQAQKVRHAERLKKINEGPELSPEARRRAELIDERNLAAQRKFADGLTKINEELRDFGRSDLQLRVDALFRAFDAGGIAGSQLNDMIGKFIELRRAMADAKKEADDLAKATSMAREVDFLFRRTRTPSEVAFASLERLKELVDEGFLGPELFSRGVNRIQDILARATPQVDATRGRAFDIGRSRIGGPSDRMIQRVNDPQLLPITDLLEQIRDSIGITN